MTTETTLDCCSMGMCMELKDKSVQEHCSAGIHCTGQEASCAASYSMDDHFRCCSCGVAFTSRDSTSTEPIISSVARKKST